MYPFLDALFSFTKSFKTSKAVVFCMDFLDDKLLFLRECIGQVECQLRVREEQKQEFVRELEQRVCEVQTAIYELDDFGLVPNNALGHVGTSQFGQRKTGLEREKKLLEREIRQQEVECWRDVTALLKELRQLRKEYRAVRQSVGLCSE